MEPHLRSPRKEYYQQHGNSVGRSPAWTPRSRGGLQRGEGPFGSGRDCGSGTYYGQDEQHISPAGHHDRFEEDSGLQKTLSNLSLGKTYSGSMEGSEMSGRLQRAHSRGLEQVAYPQQRGQQLTGRGSGELVGYPGRIAGRGEHMPGPYGPGRGRAAGPVRLAQDGVAVTLRRSCTAPKQVAHACILTSCRIVQRKLRFYRTWNIKLLLVHLLET